MWEGPLWKVPLQFFEYDVEEPRRGEGEGEGEEVIERTDTKNAQSYMLF